MTWEIFLTALLAVAVVVIVLTVVNVALTYVFEIVLHGLVPFLIVRCITFTMEHWMGSTIAWTLSIIAALWGMYPKVKQLFTDPGAFTSEMRERMDRVAKEHNKRLERYKNLGNHKEEDTILPEFRHRSCCGSCYWNMARNSYNTNCGLHPDVGDVTHYCSDWRSAQ